MRSDWAAYWGVEQNLVAVATGDRDVNALLWLPLQPVRN
jgi:hypothetical protein